jgi:hypothetical protein
VQHPCQAASPVCIASMREFINIYIESRQLSI